ncbi:MAG: hypothetical protein AB1414_00885 [bacterium]
MVKLKVWAIILLVSIPQSGWSSFWISRSNELENTYTFSKSTEDEGNERTKKEKEVDNLVKINFELGLTDNIVGSSTLRGRFKMKKGTPKKLKLSNISYITYSNSFYELKIGKQNYEIGQGHIWNPTNRFKKIGVGEIEEEDMTKKQTCSLMIGAPIEIKNLLINSFNVIAVIPLKKEKSHPCMLNTKYKIADYDLTTSYYQNKKNKEEMVGFGARGNLYSLVNMWIEMSYIFPKVGRRYHQYVVGLDHQFSNGLSIFVEYYQDKNGKKTKKLYDWESFSAKKITSLAQDYLGVELDYNFNNVIKIDNTFIRNLNDTSSLIVSTLNYNFFSGCEINIGVISPFGKEDIEIIKYEDDEEEEIETVKYPEEFKKTPKTSYISVKLKF